MSKEKDKQLVKLIKDDTKLDREDKMMYAVMAEFYLQDLKNNLNKTSIGLNEDYPESTIDEWRSFLTIPVVRKYIQGFKDEQIGVMADTKLMEGKKDAVSIKKVMEEKGPAINNSNYILVRLPDKVDFNSEGKEVKLPGV